MDCSLTDGPMDCDDALLRVYEYLDGELTVWRRRAITRHLDECPPCANGFVFEVELRRIVVSKCREEVPAALRLRIAEALGIVTNEADRPASSAPDPSGVCRTFYDDSASTMSATVEHGSRGGTVRPSEIMMLVGGVIIALAGVVIGHRRPLRPQRRQVLVLLDRPAAR